MLSSGLTQGATYRFRIFASNLIGSGLPSTDLVVAFADVPDTPSPGSLSIVSASSSAFTLQWTAGTSQYISITGYKLYTDFNQSGNYSLIYEAPSYLRSFTHSSLIKGALYSYKLSALNFVGESELLLSPVERYACDLPGSVAHFATHLINTTAVSLSWSEPLDIGGCAVTGYQLEIDDGNSGSFSHMSGSPFASTILEYTEATLFTASHLGLTFRFRVIPVNVIGPSTLYSYAETLLASVPDTPTSAPLLVNSTLTSIAV